MASHRKPRTRIVQSATSRNSAVGVTTAALASVTLLSQSAQAAPGDDKPSIEEVQKKVDDLYRQAGAETQRYNAAKEKTGKQRKQVDDLLDEVAQRTAKVNDARRALGRYATAQYRTGGMSGTATLLLSEDPQGYFSQQHLMERMTIRQKRAVKNFQEEQRAAGEKRAEATRQLESFTSSQTRLRQSKKDVQSKLTEARELLAKLTAEEKKRLAEIERKKRAEAQRKAEAAEERRRQQEEQEEQESGGSDGSYAAKAEKVIAFAKAQLGKPYVWGATGPNSYDCSGLTLDAWAAAGVSLPRTTWDQVEAGTTVAKSEMKPGDLVFFYDDISHVGIYAGGGQMIHAPKPGDVVKYESVDYMPFHSAVRPA